MRLRKARRPVGCLLLVLACIGLGRPANLLSGYVSAVVVASPGPTTSPAAETWPELVDLALRALALLLAWRTVPKDGNCPVHGACPLTIATAPELTPESPGRAT